MENKKLQNGVEEIRKITMTALEKKRVFENVLNSTIPPREQSVRSPWFTYSFIARIRKNHLAYYVVIPLIIILTGGGIALASEGSLPSSILYPIKVSIVEPIRGALAFPPKTKAKYESDLATKRLVEAETLADQGKLDKPTENRLNDLLEKHTTSFNIALNKADKIEQTTESTGQTDEIVTSFHANMNAHARVLDIINKQEKSLPDNRDSNNQDSGIQISNTARTNAEDIKDMVKNKENENKDGNNSDKYKKKKDSIESLINSTTTSLDRTNNETNKSNVRQTIINDTHKTLDEAKQFLDEANKKEKEGNRNDAYSTLLDSESSVKEADIFLKTGLKLDGENDEGVNN